MKITLNKLIKQLDDIINSHENNKMLLKDYPGIIPYYYIDNILIDKYFGLYEWNILENKVSEYYAKKEKIKGLRSEYVLNLAAKEMKISSYRDNKTKAKEYIKDALNYKDTCERNYQKLMDRINDEYNPLSLGFNFTTDSVVDYYYMRRVARRYGVSNCFPEIMKKEDDDLPNDLPF